MTTASTYAMPGIRPHITAEFEWLCLYLEVSQEWVMQRTNKREVVDIRKLICYALSKRSYTSLAIGDLLGIHHSTVLYAVKAVTDQMEIYPKYRKEVQKLMKQSTIL